jgi:hypothetical protein
MIVAGLTKASFAVRFIRTDMTAGEREQTMDEWNSPSSDVDVLVLNSSVSSAGLNCHHQCSVGIGLCDVWNVSTILQFIGRLFRIGQKSKVTWFLPRVLGTVSEWQEERRLRKVWPPVAVRCGPRLTPRQWVHDVAPRMRVTGVDQPELLQLLAYEVARIMFSHSFNRYAWVVEPPQSIGDYSSRRARLIGTFYSALVRLMMTDPPRLGDPGTKAKWEALVKYVDVLGPAFVDTHHRQGKNDAGDDIYLPVAPEDDVTWEKVFAAFPIVQKNLAGLTGRYRTPPIGEPERDRAAFAQRGRALAAELGLDTPTPRNARPNGPPSGPSPLSRRDVRRYAIRTSPQASGKAGAATGTPPNPQHGEAVTGPATDRDSHALEMGPGAEDATEAAHAVAADTEELAKAAREEAAAAAGAADKAADPGPEDATEAALTVAADVANTELAKAAQE